MNRQTLLFLLYILVLPSFVSAQADNYPGTWQMKDAGNGHAPAVYVELQVGNVVDKLLYPAKLTVQCDSFTGVYELLLYKKDSRELAISRNKFARKEGPFSLGSNLLFFNGSFDYSRTLTGKPILTLNRLPFKLNAAKDTQQLDAPKKAIGNRLSNFLATASIVLDKASSSVWKDAYAERVANPRKAPAYFGVTDTIFVKNRDGYMHLSGSKKEDVASVLLNGKPCADRISPTKKEAREDILLDTGLNLVVLYAESFGNEQAHTGKGRFEFGQRSFTLDFNNKADSGSTFIIARVYCEKDKEKDIYFSDYNPFAAGEKPLDKNEKFLGSLVSTSRQLTLAVWDDAVEDGDSISININGDWIAKGFPVKKNTQYITVTLKPGANTINFIADNLGSIAPNTAILEIIDGRKRKSFSLETVMGENNLLKIRYDVQSP